MGAYNLTSTLANMALIAVQEPGTNSISSYLFSYPVTGFVALIVLTYLVATSGGISRRTSVEQKASSSKRVKPKDRKPGTWEPVPFTRPAASPYPNWSIHDTPPLPYRPFRWGPYHITMGLRTMKWDEWIELDNQYLHYHAIKARRIAERGALCSRTDPRAFEAALELLDELASYLPQRYPSLFTRTSTGLTNTATHETFDLGRTQLRRNGGPREDPMQLAGRLLQDDVALMIEGADGRPRLLAGSILLAGFWRLTDKFGLDLAAIHTSGDVPGYDAKLDRPMANFFRRLAPDAPVLRNNYFVQVDDGLAWSSSIGREDDAGIGWATAEKDRAIAAHHFRSERQSLRRLPRSGAVVFTIRTYFVPITELAAEPGVPGRLASAVRAWGDDVGRYKGREKYGRVLLEFLDAKHAEQVAAGLDFGAEEERSSYPW